MFVFFMFFLQIWYKITQTIFLSTYSTTPPCQSTAFFWNDKIFSVPDRFVTENKYEDNSKYEWSKYRYLSSKYLNHPLKKRNFPSVLLIQNPMVNIFKNIIIICQQTWLECALGGPLENEAEVSTSDSDKNVDEQHEPHKKHK